MNIKDAIRSMVKDNHTTLRALAQSMGYKSNSSITNVMGRGNMRIDMLCGICDKLGYEVVLRPKEGTNKTERSIVISDVEAKDDRGSWHEKSGDHE